MSATWNDAWKCPNCNIEYTAENAKKWDADCNDWVATLDTPLRCGECKSLGRPSVECIPMGRNFTYSSDFMFRHYEDGEIRHEM